MENTRKNAEKAQDTQNTVTPCIFDQGVEVDVEKALFEQFIQEQIENGAEIFSAKELIDMNIDEYPFLVEDLIPERAITALVAPSEAGKSTLVYQICEAIVTGQEFLGLKVNPVYKKVLFIPTEEGTIQAALKLKAQLQEKLELGEATPEEYESLDFAFNVENVFEFVSKYVPYKQVDLVVIDCYGDVNLGDTNSVSETRKFMNMFHKLTQKHNISILLVHHINKASANRTLDKNSAIGSTGFIDKVRHMIGLEPDKENPRYVKLKILKSNLVSHEKKKQHLNLYLNDSLNFELTEPSSTTENLLATQNTIQNQEMIKRVLQLNGSGVKQSNILSILKTEGYSKGLSQSSISRIICKYTLDENQNIIDKA